MQMSCVHGWTYAYRLLPFIHSSEGQNTHGKVCGCEMLRNPHYLDSQLTDVGELVSLIHLLHTTLQKHFVVPLSVKV
jgi:hypothetical protein